MSGNSYSFEVRPITAEDHNWVAEKLNYWWDSSKLVSRGKVYQGETLHGFIACRAEEKLGLLTYRIEYDGLEVASLNSFEEGIGVGTALLKAAQTVAKENKCKRIWLVTTNDNFEALRFYQTRSFHLVAIYRDVFKEYRKLKPEIPLYGLESIPIRDEIELEMVLS